MITVRRDGHDQEVPIVEIVPGDILKLESGDIVPADAILRQARNLLVDETTFTGESIPVAKQAATAWDVSKAVAMKYTLLEEIMTRNVVISAQEDLIERAAKRLNEHNISALPVVDVKSKVIGMITSDGVSRLVSVCR